MTRVLVDGRALYDASRDRGIGTYLRNLLEALGGVPDVDVAVLATDGAELPPQVERIPVRRGLTWTRFGPAEHEVRLPWEIRRTASDIFHSAALDPPRTVDRPWVQTVQDVLPLVVDMPELAGPRRRWRRLAPRIRGAGAVITGSRFAASAIVDRLGVAADRVRVIPHGVPPDVLAAGPRLTVERPYLLYVGEYGPWKGYPEAFAAISALADRGLPHTLRVTGRLTPWTEPTVRRLVSAVDHPERVELLGLISRDELVRTIRDADAMLVSSRHEGFGLPALEAMAMGTPVVAFDNTGTAEVVADGGILVPDGDAAAMVDELTSVLTNDSRRKEVGDRGRARATAFRWSDSARQHAEVYAMVAAT